MKSTDIIGIGKLG